MDKEQSQPLAENLICVKCNVPLELGTVNFSYAGSSFPYKLYKCPKCELVFLPEDLVLGKMRKAERALEDK